MGEPASSHRDWWALAWGVGYLGLAGLATLLLAPWYLATLGAPRWGEVAWCLTAQGVLFSLDAVLGPLLLREAARAADAAAAAAVRRRFLRLFGGIALAAWSIALFATEGIDDPALARTAQLAALQALFQFANFALLGYWHGRRRQARAYARSAGFLVAKHALAVALLLGWQASGVAYFLAFALVAAIEFAANAWSTRGGSARAPDAAPRSWPLPFVVASIAAWPLGHIDRLWLASTLPAAEFGHYFLLGSLLLSMLHLQAPILRAFLPRMVSEGASVSHLRMASIGLLVLPALGLAALAEPFLAVWLGGASPDAVATLRGMMLAAACFALAAPAIAALWRDARYTAIATLSLASLSLQVVLLAAFATRLGVQAGAWAWIAAGLVQWLGGAALTRTRASAPVAGR